MEPPCECEHFHFLFLFLFPFSPEDDCYSSTFRIVFVQGENFYF